MSEFKNKSITSKGLELLSKCLSGEQLTFTKMEMGSGNYEGDTGEAIVLVQPQQTLPITKISRKGGQVTLSASLKIEDITSSFDWSEIGVYAKGNDGMELLYMYSYTQNSSFISQDSLNEKLINITVMVSNATNITATIDNSLVYLTAEALKGHEKDITTHQDIREELTALGEQLGQLDISWESIESKPVEFPSSPHNHTLNNIDGLQEALDNKSPTHAHPYASSTHTHTKSDIGLSNVPNYSATSSVSDSSTSKFATANGVKQAYDKAVEALNKANAASTRGMVPSTSYKHTLSVPAMSTPGTSNTYGKLRYYLGRFELSKLLNGIRVECTAFSSTLTVDNSFTSSIRIVTRMKPVAGYDAVPGKPNQLLYNGTVTSNNMESYTNGHIMMNDISFSIPKQTSSFNCPATISTGYMRTVNLNLGGGKYTNFCPSTYDIFLDFDMDDNCKTTGAFTLKVGYDY